MHPAVDPWHNVVRKHVVMRACPVRRAQLETDLALGHHYCLCIGSMTAPLMYVTIPLKRKSSFEAIELRQRVIIDGHVYLMSYIFINEALK